MSDIELIRERLIRFYSGNRRPEAPLEWAEQEADLILTVITDGAYRPPIGTVGPSDVPISAQPIK